MSIVQFVDLILKLAVTLGLCGLFTAAIIVSIAMIWGIK